MKRDRTQAEISGGFSDALTNLETNVQAYQNGNSASFRSVATELYILLCDKTDDGKSLLERVHPNPTLHAIKTHFPEMTRLLTGLPHADRVVLHIPHRIHIRGGKATIVDLFDKQAHRLPLGEWLDQELSVLPADATTEHITIRDLLLSARNKTTSHFDSRIDPGTQGAQNVRVAGIEYQKLALIAIGEYVATELRQLSQNRS